VRLDQLTDRAGAGGRDHGVPGRQGRRASRAQCGRVARPARGCCRSGPGCMNMHPEAVSSARPCLGTSPVAAPPRGRGAFRQQRQSSAQPMRMKRWYAGFGQLCAGCPLRIACTRGRSGRLRGRMARGRGSRTVSQMPAGAHRPIATRTGAGCRGSGRRSARSHDPRRPVGRCNSGQAGSSGSRSSAGGRRGVGGGNGPDGRPRRITSWGRPASRSSSRSCCRNPGTSIGWLRYEAT
jgi:hypothetical protein